MRVELDKSTWNRVYCLVYLQKYALLLVLHSYYYIIIIIIITIGPGMQCVEEKEVTMTGLVLAGFLVC